MITSSTNKQVKELVQYVKKVKCRKENQLFVVEGIKMFLEAPKEAVRKIYVSESFLKESVYKTAVAHLEHEILSDAVFAYVSDTKTPQGILCLVKMPEYAWEHFIKEDGLYLLLENIQDPGNLGTMFRTAEGAGMDGIIMNESCVDLFNPKTIRSTMGSIYRVPFYTAKDFKQTICDLKKENITIYAAHLKGEAAYDEMDYTKASGFLIGNEGNGLSDEVVALASTYVKIPMQGKVESLNAAIASSLLMYEAARQRRNLKKNSSVEIR